MTHQVSVSLTSPEYAKAATLARARQVTVAALLRQLLYDCPLPKDAAIPGAHR
jgi:hypothetical protein